MRRSWVLLLGCLLLAGLLLPSEARAERMHVVAKGHTLSKIARRYHVSIQAICQANAIERNAPIHPGQQLVIPDPDDADGVRARTRRDAQQPAPRSDGASSGRLDLPGGQVAYYYEPTGPGRLTLRPVIMYLHGRGGRAAVDCQR